MHNVPSPSFSNNAVPSDLADYVARPGGHADELAVASLLGGDDGHGPDEWAELMAGAEEYTVDQSIQRADEAHASALRDARRYAAEQVGTVAVKLSRDLTLEPSGTTRVSYSCIIDGRTAHHIGTGLTPRAAVDAALAMLDEHELAPHFGGFRIAGLATVGAAYHRLKADALSLARRIACDVAYLDACLAYQLPGVVDERPRRLAAVA